MKVLEIHPNHCWSFDADNKVALERLRAAVTLPDPREQTKALKRLAKSGNAYRLVGRAINLELADQFFDDVIVRYSPVEPERDTLEKQCVRWLRKPQSAPWDTRPRARKLPLRTRFARYFMGWLNPSRPEVVQQF